MPCNHFTRTGAISDLLGSYPIYVETDNQESIDQGVRRALQSSESNQRSITLPSHEDLQKAIYRSLRTDDDKLNRDSFIYALFYGSATYPPKNQGFSNLAQQID